METQDSIVLRLAGEAQGKDRPRLGKGGHVFTTKKTTVAENDVRAAWREIGEPRLPPDVGLRLTVKISTVRPKTHFRSDGITLSAQGLRSPTPSNRKPDVDNALKLVMDALNGRAYKDDTQIVRATVYRVWSEWPETVIHLRKHEDECLATEQSQ